MAKGSKKPQVNGVTCGSPGSRLRDSNPRPTHYECTVPRPPPLSCSRHLQSRGRGETAPCPIDPNQLGGVARASGPGTFQGLSALPEGLPGDFLPPDAASPRKIGKGLRRRSEALPEAKPQVAADESGCTPGSVTRRPHGHRGDGHPSRAGVAAGLVRSTRGLGRAALERPRRAAFHGGPS
jgi:hypothetical protein